MSSVTEGRNTTIFVNTECSFTKTAAGSDASTGQTYHFFKYQICQGATNIISAALRGDHRKEVLPIFCNPSNPARTIVTVNHLNKCCEAYHSGQVLWQESRRFGAVTLHGCDTEVVSKRSQRTGGHRDKMVVKIMGC